MKSPETRVPGTDKPKESSRTEAPVEAAPLSNEMKKAMQEEIDRLQTERNGVQETTEKEFKAILGLSESSTVEDVGQADFRGVEKVRDIFGEHQGDVPALQRALQELSVPLLLKMGTLGKIQRFAERPDVKKLVAIDKQIEELDKKLYPELHQ